VSREAGGEDFQGFPPNLNSVAAEEWLVPRNAAGSTNIAAGQQARMVSVRQVNSAAHEAYLKGNFYWSRSNCDGSQRGLPYYQQAVTNDPTFAPAYVGLAQAYFTLGDWGCSPHADAFSKSKAAALKALELDQSLGSAHVWLGTLAYFYDWDWDNAEKEYRQAVGLDSNYAPARS
jgi:tetratricopeptide (TPR) repeat protein